MSAIDFPNSPSVDDVFTVGDRSWKWDGTVWKSNNTSVNAIVLDDLGDVNTPSPSDFQVLAYNAGLWVSQPNDFQHNADIALQEGLFDGDILRFNETAQKWQNTPMPSGESFHPFLLMGA